MEPTLIQNNLLHNTSEIHSKPTNYADLTN